jgi:hypothetical protein
VLTQLKKQKLPWHAYVCTGTKNIETTNKFFY